VTEPLFDWLTAFASASRGVKVIERIQR